MPLRFLAIIIASLSLTNSLYANGGVFYSSVMERTGNLVPMRKPLISLDAETLGVVINQDAVAVSVTYNLTNHGPADSVAFGFPVDLVMPESIDTPNGYDYILSFSLAEFKIKDGAKELLVEKTITEPLSGREASSSLEQKIRLFRRWSLMTLPFAAGEKKTLSVSYKVTSIGRDKGFEGDTLWQYGPRYFQYVFHPAASWGNGRVGHLQVSLDATWLRRNDLPPVSNLSLPHGDEDAGKVSWAFQDVDLATLSNLSFSYEPGSFYQDARIKKCLLESPAFFTLSVSSSLPGSGSYRYGKESAQDRDLRTAWVEGVKGTGLGETITFHPKGSYVTEVGLLNGFVANETFYYDNARIKKMRVEIRCGEGAEENGRYQTEEIIVPDRLYKKFSPRYPFDFVDWVVRHPQGDGFIEEVKITILETYPGRKFEDLAVTEFYVCGFKR